MTDGAGKIPSNPYIGARPFRRNETIYGRAREARDLLSLLVGDRIVLLNSPSGAGKTSLIQAALIPRLEQRRFVVRPTIRVGAPSSLPGANRYLLSVMQSLEDARPAAEQLAPEELAGLTLDAYLSSRSSQGAENGQVLIFDQFEEVLTLDPTDEAARLAFFEQLGDALADPWRWALFAIREEYVAALEPYANLVPSRFANTFRLELLGVEAAGEAIRGPARSRGAAFEDVAVEELARDLAQIVVQDAQGRAVERTGASVEPVQLQVVCYRLWERRFPEGAAEGQTISVEDVRSIGSIDRALEEYYDSGVARAAAAGAVRERAVRGWFDSQLITRQGFRSQVLQGNEGSFGLNDAAVDGLTNAYLVREERRRGVTWLELAHDRLIAPVRASNKRWFTDNLSPFQRQAETWAAQGQPPSLLFRDAELLAAEQWVATADALTDDEQKFLDACREERRRAEERARQARRIRNLAVGASIAAVLAIVAAFTAVGFYNDANAQRLVAVANGQTAVANERLAVAQQATAESSARVSRARELAAAARTQLEVDPELSLLLALRAAITTQADDPGAPEAGQVLQQAVQESRLQRSITLDGATPAAAAYSPDGGTIAAAGFDGKLYLWGTADPQAAPRSIDVHPDGVYGVAYSPDGQLLATTSGDLRVGLWSAASGELLRSTDIYSPTYPSLLTISPDSALVAAASYDSTLVYILSTGSLAADVPALEHPQNVESLAFSPDSDLLATASRDGVLRLWDTRSGALRAELSQQSNSQGAGFGLFSVAFSPDGAILASSGRDALIHLWDVASGREIRSLLGHSDTVTALAFSPDGSYIASGGVDASIRLWDVAAGRLLFTLRGHGSQVSSLEFSPDGNSLLSASYDGTLRVWSLALVHGQAVNSVAYSPDGLLIATAAEGGAVKLWDAESGRMSRALTTDEAQIISVDFSPDGSYVAAAGLSGSAYLWRLADPAPPTVIAAHANAAYSVAFSADSSLLATSGLEGTARIWDVATGAQRAELLSEASQLNNVSFSADGSLLAAAASNDGVLVWDIAARSLTPSLGHAGQAVSVAFSPQGRRLAVASSNAAPAVYDLAAGTSLVIEKAPPTANQIVFSADGGRVATANADGTVRVWDSVTGQALVGFAGMNSPNDAYFSPDGSRLVMADKNGAARVALLDPGQLYALASSRVVRNFSEAECETYALVPCAWDGR